MGKVPSAATLSSIAYLTDTGRRYLFGKDNNGNNIRFNADGSDNFQIGFFGLFDSDTDYNTSQMYPTGQMPDIAGTADNGCLKTSADIERRNQIVYQGTIIAAQSDLQYVANPSNLQIDTTTL